MTAKRKTKRRREGPGLPGEEGEEEELKLGEERDGIVGRAKASGIKLKENGGLFISL